MLFGSYPYVQVPFNFQLGSDVGMGQTRAMTVEFAQDWYLFFDLKRRPLQKSVWIPLRALEHFRHERVFG